MQFGRVSVFAQEGRWPFQPAVVFRLLLRAPRDEALQ